MSESGTVPEILSASGAWLRGHFLLTSGLHSDQFLIMARAFERPAWGRLLGAAVADLFRQERPQAVVGPAMGGVILAYEVAAALGARALFTEKSDAGMALKRGFRLAAGERVLVVEDAVSTGGSVQKVLDHLRGQPAQVVGVAAVADRSAGQATFGVPFRAAWSLAVNQWPAAECPLCAQAVPLTRPKEG
ncbi:MAG: orotate phosphoribosyltransferase [Sulfobacillus sp.]